jgi:ketosteroid isomerase-like protein
MERRMTSPEHSVSYIQPTRTSPWGTYLAQVDRIVPYLGDLSRWLGTLTRPKRALIVDVTSKAFACSTACRAGPVKAAYVTTRASRWRK